MQALLATTGRFSRAPVATLLTVLVMALGMALPQFLQSLIDSTRSATGNLAGAITISVYLKTEVSVDKAGQLARQAQARRGVAGAELITADAALRQFRERTGFSAAIDALDANPLPHTLVITPARGAADLASVESLRRFLASWPETASVQVDAAWVARFNALLGMARAVLVAVAVLLAAAVIAVAGNTIRLEILARRAEIEVIKLVGGSNGFVRRPFLYTGVMYGVLAAVLAWLIVAVALWSLRGPAAEVATAYGSQFSLRGATLPQLGWLLVGGFALGWLGAFLATARHLAQIEPRA